MSDSLKQDVINIVGRDNFIQQSKEIKRMFEDADKGICSNISINEDLNIYNVQFDVMGFDDNHMNKIVIALDEDDAKEIIIKRYGKFNVDINDLYCEQVNIKRGMIFNA